MTTATFIKRYCGNREPWSVYSTGRGLTVLLTSTVRHRFRAEYEAVNVSEWRFLKSAMKLLEGEGRLVTSNATVSVMTKTHAIHKWYIKAAIRKYIQLSWQIKKNENDSTSFFKVYRGRSEQGILFPGTEISGESARSGNLTSLLFELYVVVGVSIEYDDVFSLVARYRTLDPPKCFKRSRYRSSRPLLCVEDMKLTATDNIKIHKSAFQINQNGTYKQYSIEIGRPGLVANFKLHQLWFPYKNNRLCHKAGIMLYTVTSQQHRPLLGPICSRNAIFQEPIPLPDTTVHVVVYAEPYSDKVELSSAYFLDIELELVQDFPRGLLSPPSDYVNSTRFSGQQDGLTITVNNLTTADSVSHSLSLSLTENTLSSLSHILIFYAGQYDDVRSATFSIQINVTDSLRRAHATVKMYSDSDLQDCIKAMTNIGNGKVPLLTTAHFEGTSFDVEYSIRCPWVASSFRLHLAVYTASDCIADYTTPLSWNNDQVHAMAIPFDCSHRHCNCFHQSSPVPHPSLQQKDLYYYHTKFGTGIDGPPWQYYIIELRPEECQSLSSAHTFIESKHAEIREFMNTTVGDSIQLAYWKRPTSSASVIKTIGSYEVNVRLYFESDYMMSPKRHLELVYSLFQYDLTIDGDTYEASECRGGEIAFDGACYGLNASPANITWAESEVACRRLGGNLVSIVSEKELSFLKTAIRTRWKNAIYLQKKNVVFIGLMKEKNKNWFRWSDSSPIGVTDWFRPSWPTDINVTDILEHPSISKLLHLYRFLETQQPLMDVSLNCTMMLIHGAEQFTNWVTIPCYFPMERVSYICKRMTESKLTKLSKETRSYFKKIGIDHDVYDDKKHDIGKSVPSCGRGWLYHQGVCYRLSNLDYVFNTSNVGSFSSTGPRHPPSRAEHETWESMARMCNMSLDVCRPAFPMETMATTPDLMSALERYHHAFGDGGVWIPDNAGTCSTLLNAGMSLTYTVGNLKTWFKECNVSFQKEQWFLFELLKKSPLKLRTPYIVQNTRHVLCRTPPEYKFMTKPTADPTLDRNAVEKYCPSPWHFRCSDKTCILQHHKCDGIKDCLDESDELDCLYLDSCDKHRCYHKCNNGQYVPLSKACDFIADCKDASDESNCVFQTCPNDTFSCKNGQCVSLDHRCDGKVHCFDGSDEKQCDFSTTACLRGTRVPAISSSILAPFCPSQLNITLLYQTRETCAEGTFSCSDSDPSCYSLAETCIYEFDDQGHLFPCRMGEHLSNCEDFECPSDYFFKCPRSYCISLSRVCDGTWDCPYGLDEKSCERYSCPGMFRCQGHRECIHHDLVCDGIVHCKDTGDDEKFCKTPKCPLGCYCMGFTIDCSMNDLRELPAVDKEIRGLFLPFNKLAPNSSSFHGYHYLRVLDLSENDIKELIPNTFQDLVNLVELNLANNDISAIKKGAFVGLANLRTLNIGGNPLYVLKSFAFSELKNLPSLNIYKTKLQTIESNAFHGMSELKNLSIEQSDLTTVTNHSFSGLQKLELLSLDGNKLPPQSVPYGIFLNLSDNITLNTGSFRLCCLAQHIPNCLPHSNEFSSCEYLIDDMVIRLLAGCLAGVAFTCNLVVIIWRCTKVSNSEKIIPLLLENMAYSNMLMGLYLVIVTSADLHYRFIGPVYAVEFDEPWRDMFWCRFAGFVFVLSNQVSMLTVGIVMYECYACVVLPHLSNFRLKRRTAFISIAWLWSVSMLFSLLPFLGIPRLNVRSPVCQIFHFSQGTDQDWGYFTFIFLGFYSLVLVAITYGLLRIWCHIPKKDQNLDEDYFAERTAIKRRVVRVVTMDVACWWMVHILGILALAGVQIDKQLSAYTMLVIWPMPAVVNPILYFIFYIKKGIKYPDYMEVYEPCEKHVSFFGMEVETSI
ncbi:uncharacterized protein LOC106174585 [Lingula anatina]|uniref:Uncharacterized protein LOC106174585 n=1 Tax=Lingula anatina TaxID=7574 RepID=A0A1S3JNV1_LINAN|nr:uncharacterized protein LOC106174585 [Lingula anatina]|eukprot:XP_013411659.1 uncharacterized protein LOC106174585 [Lingula anatina]